MNSKVKRNRYRNPLRTPAMTRIVFLSLTAGVVFAAFGIVRNRHVKKGDGIAAAEKSVAKLGQEIEMWELRVAGMLDRAELARRLAWVESDLGDIRASKVLVIEPSTETPALPKVAAR